MKKYKEMKENYVCLPSVDPLLLDVDDTTWLESFTGKVLVGFSSTVGGCLEVDDGNGTFLLFILLTVVLLEFSFLIAGVCDFFFELVTVAFSTLIFLLLVELTVDAGENDRFCGGEGRGAGSGGIGGDGCSSSASLSPLSSLLLGNEWVSRIFYIVKKK